MSDSGPAKASFRLAPISIDHVNDFHKLWSNEQAALYSQRDVSTSFEESLDFFQNKVLKGPACRPWGMKRAIMARTTAGEEAVGFITVGRPSPNGLMIGYILHPEQWNKGYGTAAVQRFLDEYWSESREAPRSQAFASRDARQTEQEMTEQEINNEIMEIRHVVGEVMYENVGSMRVMEKCGGRTIGSADVRLRRFEELKSHAIWRLDKPVMDETKSVDD